MYFTSPHYHLKLEFEYIEQWNQHTVNPIMAFWYIHLTYPFLSHSHMTLQASHTAFARIILSLVLWTRPPLHAKQYHALPQRADPNVLPLNPMVDLEASGPYT